MNPRVSESPTAPVSRTASPSNQWPQRSGNYTTPQDNQTVRPFGPNSYPQFGPNIGNQRFFTPRCSYFGPQNVNQVFTSSSAANVSQSYNNDNNYSVYDSMNSTQALNPSYALMDTNRPVYSTPDTSTNVRQVLNSFETSDDIDVNLLKSALDIINKAKDQTFSQLPESTVHSSDPKPNRMTELINELRALEDMDKKEKQIRKDVQKKIDDLDEELKAFEKKIIFRDKLKTIKDGLESNEEVLSQKRSTLISQIEDCNKRQGSDSEMGSVVDTSESQVRAPIHKTTPRADPNVHKSTPRPNPNVHKTTPRPDPNVHKTTPRPDPNVQKTTPRPALKRPNLTSNSSNVVKKVRISAEVNQLKDKSLKTTERPQFRRTPIPFKHPKPVASSAISSPKIDRICRQPPTLASNAGTSGVRTSRPVKPSCSRTQRLTDSIDTTNKSADTSQTSSSEAVNPSLKPNALESTKKTSDIESDNGVFAAIAATIASKPKTPTNTVTTPVDNESNRVQTPEIESKSDNKDKSEELVKELANESTEQTPEDQNNENFDIVTIDSADEEYEESDNIKIPGMDDLNDLDYEEDCESPSDSSAGEGVLPEQSNEVLNSDTLLKSSNNENPLKAPTDKAFNKKLLKYNGFENIEFESTVEYSLPTLKPTAGPKSKSHLTSVIALKSFKDYLFVSLMDASVRRYHINDSTNYTKLEGHESHVFAMIVVESIKSADTFILYTGGRDKKLRAFDAMSCALLKTIEVEAEIGCLDYNWSHVFCALFNGNVCKVSSVCESEQEVSVESFVVNANKRIFAVIGVQVVEPLDNDIQPVITVSQNKMRIINTKESVKDEERILQSFAVNYYPPIFARIFRNHLFISYKCPPIKNEEKDKSKGDRSKVLVFDLKKDWIPVKTIEISGIIPGLDLLKDELIIYCYTGEVQCIDCSKLDLKWIAYSSNITTCAKIGTRLLVGNDKGVIDLIYLDQTMIDCDICGVTFARQKDFKEHIQLEHSSVDPMPSDV